MPELYIWCIFGAVGAPAGAAGTDPLEAPAYKLGLDEEVALEAATLGVLALVSLCAYWLALELALLALAWACTAPPPPPPPAPADVCDV